MIIRRETVFLLTVLVAGILYFIQLNERLGGDLFVTVTNYIFMACVIVIGSVRYKRIVNPVTLLAPLMLAFTYYGLMISSRQEPLGLMVLVSYYLFVSTFLVGCMIPFRLRTSRIVDSPAYRLRLCDLLLVAALVVLVAEAILFGGFPLLLLTIQEVDSYAEMRLIPVAHYFVMLSAFLPSLYYYSYKEGVISRRRLILCALLVVFILLNTLSRQIMIFGVVAFYLTYSRLNNVNESRLFAIIVGLAIVLFLGMGELRIGAINSSISPLEYLKIYSDVPDTLPVNTFEVTFNLYTSLNFNTFNNIVRELDSFYFGAYTFRPILDITKINSIFGTGIPESRDTVKMLATIIADPYLDLGLPGVFIFALGYGIFGSYSYSAYKRRANAAYTLLWATFAFVMVMAVFTNFFNLFFIWLCIGICLIILFQPGRK